MGRYSVGFIFVYLLFFAAFVAAGEAEDVRADRPDKDSGATEVDFFVFVLDVDDIDGAEQNFTVNVFLLMSWQDERLAVDGNSVRTLPLEEVWNPRIMITNKQFFVRKTFPDIVRVTSEGVVTYSQRYVGPLSQPLRLSEFPFDQHVFTIQFASPGYSNEEIRFVASPSRRDPELVGGGIATKLSLPDWEIVKYVVETRPYMPTEDVEVPGFVFEFMAKRYVTYYLWHVIMPLVFIVIMSWGGFWIDPTNAGAQIGVSTSAILTLIAYRFMLSNLLPRLPYMTRMDLFTLGSTALVFLTLVEVLITTKLVRIEKEKPGRRIDAWCRFVFPAAFTALIYWSLIH